MPFPRRVRSELAQTDTSDLSGDLSYDRVCEGAKFHSPNPLVLHTVSVGTKELLLCGTCRANLEVLRHLLAHNGGELDWPVRREFGNQIRAIAETEWKKNV